MKKAFVIDLSICNGCYCCQIACKDEHVANNWLPYAMPQPDTGQFWIGIEETVRGTVPKVKVSYVPKMCAHCEDAPCMNDCKSDAIYKREDGLVVIDPAKCTGCKLCADACPYDAIFFNENLNIAQKCTGCAHLLDDGWDVPRCVDQCPTGAMKFADESELKDLIEKADARSYKDGLKTNVHYLNLPKKFVAGTLYDPSEKEVVIGAKCVLTDTESGEAVTGETDNFGDFWFRGLGDNRAYSLKLEKDGKSIAIDDISTEKDVNLGDIALS
jgi:Fe-S-cluster-containing dehydrogenase component